MLYQFVVFLQVISVLGYLLAHGVSAAVSFALKKERDIARVRALLDLSAASYPSMLWTLFTIVVFELAAAFLNMVWWIFSWIWASIVLLVVIVVLMAIHGASVFEQRRSPRPWRKMGAETKSSDWTGYALSSIIISDNLYPSRMLRGLERVFMVCYSIAIAKLDSNEEYQNGYSLCRIQS